jgi:N6-L-threonylcarbamoyladenine synthase
LDTSAYTTSAAVVDEQGNLVWETRKVLDVPLKETGLAQSAAFFQHIQNLPGLTDALPPEIWRDLRAVGVSVTPRPVPGSYMPVFTAGTAAARMIAAARELPLFQTTHQEGHIAAGLATASSLAREPFLAVHLSGGTTELLRIQCLGAGKIQIERLGGTTDLHAGQFIDRVGVRLGTPFPAGKHLERLASEASPEAASWLPSSVKGLEVSFSGVETAAARLLAQGKGKADVARAVEGCIARTVAKLILRGKKDTGRRKVLIVGGVAANQFIRQEIVRRVENMEFYWAKPELSSDNAVGVALLTKEGNERRGGIVGWEKDRENVEGRNPQRGGSLEGERRDPKFGGGDGGG